MTRKDNKDTTKTYKARTVHIKDNTPLASILNQWAQAATRLHNSATFLNRNTITGLALPEEQRHPNQQYAIGEIENILPKKKKTRWKSTTRKLEKTAQEVREALAKGDEKKVIAKKKQGVKDKKAARKELEKKSILNAHHRRANYSELDAYYKYANHEAYRVLPAHAAQNILRDVNQAWDNWGAQLHNWRHGNSMGLTGRPGMPNYKDKKTRKAIELPAADITIIEKEEESGQGTRAKKRTYAQLPLVRDDELIEITGIMPDGGRLVTVQVNPVSGGFDVVFVFEVTFAMECSVLPNLAGGDLGLDNLLTIVVNDGTTRPLIIDGRELKSINHYWNTKIAQMKSELPHDVHTSGAIIAAWRKRRAQLHDGLNRAAGIAVAFLVRHGVREFVVGKNDGWKEDFAGKVPTKRKNKQDFVFMPYDYLLNRLADKCHEAGISLIVREESYTSKASLMDGDFLPIYGGVVPDGGYEFSGCRKSRGLYQSKKTMIGGRGVLLNADVNGAGNILRKEHGDAFESVDDWRFLMCPERVRLSLFTARKSKGSSETDDRLSCVVSG